MKNFVLFFLAIVLLFSGCASKNRPMRAVAKEPAMAIQNIDTHSNLIRVENIKKDDVVMSPLMVSGQARGMWFFEGSFPVSVVDATGKEIGSGLANASKEWMTEDFVPFTANINFSLPKTHIGFILLKKDNPSGLPDHDDLLRFPVKFFE